jgi:hypothetical protein
VPLVNRPRSAHFFSSKILGYELLARALRRIALELSPSSNQIEVRDSYLKFLLYANAGMLNTGNLYLMEYAVSHLPTPAPILEIGSFCGLSANIFTYFKLKHGVRNRPHHL